MRFIGNFEFSLSTSEEVKSESFEEILERRPLILSSLQLSRFFLSLFLSSPLHNSVCDCAPRRPLFLSILIA